MKKRLILEVLVIGFLALNLNGVSYAQQVLRPEGLKEFKQAAREVLVKGITPTPGKAISVLRYLDMIDKGLAKDPDVAKVLAQRGAVKLGTGFLIDAAIDAMVENMKTRGMIKPESIIDEHVVKLWMKTAKNMVLGGDIKGELITVFGVGLESWQDTTKVLDSLPAMEKLSPEQQEYMKDLYTAKELMDGDLGMKVKALGMAFMEGVKRITNLATRQAPDDGQKLLYTAGSTIPYSPELAKKLSDGKLITDSSQLSERTSQQLLKPVNVSFTQTFDGLFTQSADSPGSIGGNHSGTLTTGTRIGAGSRPGDFTSGSFSGRTIAETGWTPATNTNVPFSGTSVGTATARGFQEGELKGSMTVTIPAGTQTATVSGDITISTDGSLSMPSYSGPGTVDATGEKVGTMSGSWSQGPTS